MHSLRTMNIQKTSKLSQMCAEEAGRKICPEEWELWHGKRLELWAGRQRWDGCWCWRGGELEAGWGGQAGTTTSVSDKLVINSQQITREPPHRHRHHLAPCPIYHLLHCTSLSPPLLTHLLLPPPSLNAHTRNLTLFHTCGANNHGSIQSVLVVLFLV